MMVVPNIGPSYCRQKVTTFHRLSTPCTIQELGKCVGHLITSCAGSQGSTKQGHTKHLNQTLGNVTMQVQPGCGPGCGGSG
eukprot:981561-Pelagomonas_calceolata.AAC.4